MITIIDVAREAGVSIATVSRVVNQPALVRKETLDKVHGTMARLNYNPNRQAHSLRSGSAKSVALLVGDISAPFFGALARSLSREGEARGYGLVLHDLDNRTDRLIAVLSRLHRSDTSCVIIALSAHLKTPLVLAAIAEAQARGLNVVTNSQIVDDSVSAVLPRFDVIAADAVRYLLTRDAEILAFVGGSSTSTMTVLGEEGFLSACDKAGLGVENRTSLEGNFQVEATRAEVRAVLETSRQSESGAARKVGLVCQTTRMAVGAVLATLDLGLNVPRDVLIICCEELPQATVWMPELTTLSVSIDELGVALFDRLLDKKNPEMHTFLDHKLIERGST